MALLEVNDLKTYFRTDDGIVKAVDGVNFTVEKGKTLGIVGESGSRQERHLPDDHGPEHRSGTRSRAARRSSRARTCSTMKPSKTARHPRQRHRDDLPGPDDVAEPGAHDRQAAGRGDPAAPRRHEQGRRRRGRSSCSKAVGIPRAERRIDDYPHQFSGGMRQRVMIAMALVNDPDLLIADEPTTALDVTTQAQILELMNRLQREFGSAIIIITHDLGVVAETADEVVVMYAARVVENGPVDQIFKRPHMPYTWGLLGSLPRLDADLERLDADPRPAAVAAQPAARLPVPPALPVRHEHLQGGGAGAAADQRRPGAPPGLPPRRADEGPGGRQAPRRNAR